MEAACRGAFEAGGTTIGLLPGPTRAAGNPFLTVALPTGLGEMRNPLLIRMCDAIIAIGGSWGTLSEIALARRTAIPVVLIHPWQITSAAGSLEDPGVTVDTAAAAVTVALQGATTKNDVVPAASADDASASAEEQADRALGALQGLALGDALGMPTQSLSRREIRARYGTVDRLWPGPADQPIAPNMPAGSITDDTYQALLLARELIVGNGNVDPRSFARALSKWQAEMTQKGSLDLLGPSTRHAIELVERGGDPTTTGTSGTTNGAAMRIAPVGIACRTVDIVDAVEQACLVTHHTTIAISGAVAVAAAISAGVDGTIDVTAAIETGLSFAEANRGTWQPGAHLPSRTRWAIALLRNSRDEEVADTVDREIGTSLATQESVVAALALADRFQHDPQRALFIAASVGGDTDTIAAITGAVLGACCGTSAWRQDLITQVMRTNHLELADTARELLRLRAER